MKKTKSVLIFFVCGLAAGFGFGALLTTPRLLTFWFVKGDKFLIPTYRYYLGVGIFLLLGLAVAHSIARMTSLLHENPSLFRKSVSGGIIAASPCILFVAANALMLATATPVETPGSTILLQTNIDPITLYIWGIIAFVLLLSTACWILTAKLYYIGVFLSLLTLPAAFGLIFLIAKVAGEWSEFVIYPVFFSLLSASSGFWIASSRIAR